MHVVLDTSIYRHDPQRKKAAFKAITSLAANNHITLHVPHVVKEEFLSYKKKICQTNINGIEVASKKLLSSLGTANADLVELYNNFVGIKDALIDLSQADFNEWLEETDAVIHPIS